MKYISKSMPSKRMDGIQVYYSTKIIVEPTDNLRKVLTAIFDVGIAELGKNKNPEFSIPTMRNEIRMKILTRREYNGRWKKNLIHIKSWFQYLCEWFSGSYSGEGLFAGDIGLEVYVMKNTNGGYELQLCNNVFEPVFGNPDDFLQKVNEMLLKK